MEDNADLNTKKFFDTTLKARRKGGTELLYDEIKNHLQKGMTFQSFSEQLNSMIQELSGGENSITLNINCISWPEEAIPYTKLLMFHLRKIYIIPKPGRSPEYGIWLEILNDKNDMPQELIEILQIPVIVEGLYLKIWNTKNKTILQQMEAL